ncbi:MAG TPA: chromosome segregation protein SMC [Rhizomicrobium sp.]|nr:chromosome segregation protein SMC [Rhizomicrobium sp.]
MKFTRLRLSGFKSFVEPTELQIEPGLTAIVGPNGCGKSNLFDALRWVMGETRPTSVRGTEMDDVIFAGSAARPARNVAEVILYIDNADRSAPAAFNEYDTIEVSRRIEREAGSVYRINGRDLRQRDVQIFFADASSGAASTAFVRQGQIGILISQKPLARRAILEEAAGIGGLHQRRHEAELRLRAAETNMARVDDLIREVDGQLQNLKRQARQAARYRNLSGLIRKAEAVAHHLRWTAADAHLHAARDTLETAGAHVADCTTVAAEAATARLEAADAVEPLRLTEAERAAALHRLALERDALDQEEARAREAAQRQRQRIAQADQDLTRERALDADAGQSLVTLAQEANALEAENVSSADGLAAIQIRATECENALPTAERGLEQANAALAEWSAKTQSHSRAREIAEALFETSSVQREEAALRRAEALAGVAEALDVQACEAEAVLARQIAVDARDALDAAGQHLQNAEKTEREARLPLESAERETQRLSAEAKALTDLLNPGSGDLWPRLVDSVSVANGYESAFAAALGDDLEAPLDDTAPNHWRDLGALELSAPLPEGAQPLTNFVTAPSALARRLSMTGLVQQEMGVALQRLLLAGQRLVSQRGDLWRWDGYAMSADAPSPAALRLAQRNRLIALTEEIILAREIRAEAFARYSAARDASEQARYAVRGADEASRSADRALSAAQEAAANAARIAAERSAKLATFEAEIRRLTEARDAASVSSRQAHEALAQLGNGEELTQAVVTTRQGAAEARAAHLEARAALDASRRENEMRRRRLSTLADDRQRWESRREAALRQIDELMRRIGELQAELETFEAIPDALAAKREALLDAIGLAEAARKEAADARIAAEALLASADKSARAADAGLSSAREERARAEALAQSAEERLSELQTRIRDELDIEPDALAGFAGIENKDELPPLEQSEKRVEKLKAEREQLGGVNLRAEEEAAEHGQRLDTLTSDRADLDGAIQRLRRGIQSLNHEGRERLLEAFEKVNTNFQLLFSKLFEGGEAKLTLTESEDPLEAGLEIFARPPGKRLQSLSLLSGGEQALTAMALILAVFLVNPAPVCVLDEVDAPLDDANVDRFCNLLEEMTRLTETRFIVITHHALTMSRVHRLFGVTMAERGVSQLVSVNLSEAERALAAE